VCVQWTPQVDKQLFYFPPCLCAHCLPFFLAVVVVAVGVIVVGLLSSCFALSRFYVRLYVCVFVYF